MREMQEALLLSQAEEARTGGRVNAAIQLFNRLLAINPDHAEGLRGQALALRSIGNRAQAIEFLARAVALRPEEGAWHFDLAQLLEARQDLAGAFVSYVNAEHLDPSDARAPGRIAMLARRLRDYDASRAAAGRALALEPNQPRALLALSDDAADAGRLEEAEDLARRVAETCRSQIFKAMAWHRIGRIHERAGRHAEAFAAHTRANEIKASTKTATKAINTPILPFEPSLNYAERYKAWARERYDDGIPAPVVLCGFVRCGTTMVEQMLAAHPRIATSDEMPLFAPVRAQLEKMWKLQSQVNAGADPLESLTEGQVRKLRGVYRGVLEHSAGEGGALGVAPPEGVVLVDKHALRTLDLGLLNRLFPEARVIFMVRDPRDVCLSAFTQDFVVNATMARFLSMETTVRFYERVMRFWLALREMLTIDVLEVRYEDLVRDFGTWGPRIVEFAGVEWEESVGRFHDMARERAVRTASYRAVTEPLNDRSIGRWKNYREQLAPVLERLEPYVEAFGYEPTGSA